MPGSPPVRVVLALVLAVTLAGCGAVNVPFVDDDEASDGPGTEIATDAVAEMQSVSSYNFSMHQVVEFGQNQLNMSADGTVNHASERLFMESVLGLETNTSRSKDFSRVYLLDDTRCRYDDAGRGDPGWNVTTNASGAWHQGLTPGEQGRLLNATGTTAVLVENTTIRGQDAYVIRITPNHDALTDVVANNSQVDFSTVDVRNATITQYVAHDSKRLLRSEMHVEYFLDGRLTTMRLTMTYSSFGDVPEITPTEDAREAGCTTNASA
jgi:outer membrane lipoprotein-sorting protein